jgi:hypothetical protein
LLIDLDFAFSFANTLLPRESLSNVKLRNGYENSQPAFPACLPF